MLVYVDDFKMAGTPQSCAKLWAQLREKLDLEEPHTLERCLGCHHHQSEQKLGNGRSVRVMRYDMTEFINSCVARYLDVAGGNTACLKSVPTPFLSEPDPDPAGDKADGRLGESVASVLMKILYAARMVRFDLLKAIQALASRIHKWTSWCDKALHRLVCYIHTSADHTLVGYVGDSLSDTTLRCYADADFAGCKATYKSTSGLFACVRGGNTVYPIAARCIKQTCVSHSTPEAEIVAGDACLRLIGIPLLDAFDVLSGRKYDLDFREDNQTMISVCTTGRNPTMRHVQRTHGVSIAWLHQIFTEYDNIYLTWQNTAGQTANILTKALDATAWARERQMIGVCKHGELPLLVDEYTSGGNTVRQTYHANHDDTTSNQPKSSNNVAMACHLLTAAIFSPQVTKVPDLAVIDNFVMPSPPGFPPRSRVQAGGKCQDAAWDAYSGGRQRADGGNTARGAPPPAGGGGGGRAPSAGPGTAGGGNTARGAYTSSGK